MSNWSLDAGKAKQAKQQVETTSGEIRKLLEQYTTARTALLNSWEGSKKDEFVSQTNNGFENTAQALMKAAGALANAIESTAGGMQARDQEAAQIINGN